MIHTVIPIICIVLTTSLLAADWPMWRHDESRGAVSPEELPAELHVQWRRHLEPVKPAYRSPRLQFDRGHEPIVLGKRLFVGSSATDSVIALDTETGAKLWCFHTEGPVRFAPVAWKDHVFVGSDDGFLYCLDAATGVPHWKFRAVPSSRKTIGNGRLISMWPVRGGPVVVDGRIYFAAGVWPFEGVFIYALDAATGDVIWLNDRTGTIHGQHPHGARALGGVTPQGYLVVNGDELVVPCGTAYPARLDLGTGRLVAFDLPTKSRFPGGWFASAELRRGRGDGHGTIRFDRDVNRQRHEDNLRHGAGIPGLRSTITVGGRKFSVEDTFDGVPGTIHSMIAADHKLFVATLEGDIVCLAARRGTPRHIVEKPAPLARPADGSRERVERILALSGRRHGYALVWGLRSGGLLRELAVQTEMQIVGVDTDASVIGTLRNDLGRAGLLGARVSLWHGTPRNFDFPPYMADLIIVAGDPESAGAERIYRSLHPFGGAAIFRVASERQVRTIERLRALRLPGSTVRAAGDMVVLRREGPLPGATDYVGEWKSPDNLVRAPVGVLWYDDTPAFFKRSPQPKFVGGVMIGRDKRWTSGKPPYSLDERTFSDVYTGRVLSSPEVQRLADTLPPAGPAAGQPALYQPPSEMNARRSEKPRIGPRINPLTGLTEPRTFPKSYGCDGGVDYGHIFTMRSGTPSFYDKRIESGTINLSGPRSGCTNTIIPAGGLLNVPYFYAGCTCSYPLPAGLALVAMPEVHEQWAVWGDGSTPGTIQRVGINLGAPGDRMTRAGTLWLDHPNVGGPSPELALSTVPGEPEFFRRHSVWIEGGRGWPWVGASGAVGLESLRLGGMKSGLYTLALYFVEPDRDATGERVLGVSIQGQRRIGRVHIRSEAGGAMRVLVREFTSIHVDGELTIDLHAVAGKTVLCGVEAVLDGLPRHAPVVLEDTDTRQRRAGGRP